MKTGLDELQQLYADKAKDLEARTEELQSGAQAVDELGENLQSMGVMVAAVEGLLEAMSPCGRDAETLAGQRKELESVASQLEEGKLSLDKAQKELDK